MADTVEQSLVNIAKNINRLCGLTDDHNTWAREEHRAQKKAFEDRQKVEADARVKQEAMQQQYIDALARQEALERMARENAELKMRIAELEGNTDA